MSFNAGYNGPKNQLYTKLNNSQKANTTAKNTKANNTAEAKTTASNSAQQKNVQNTKYTKDIETVQNIAANYAKASINIYSASPSASASDYDPSKQQTKESVSTASTNETYYGNVGDRPYSTSSTPGTSSTTTH